MCAIHLNTNSHLVNVSHHISQTWSAESSNGGGLGVAPTANNQGPISKRVKHSYLTGIYYWYISQHVSKPFTSY
jgi:hypothetical protein